MRTIKRINARIGVIERRVGHLQDRVDDPGRRDASKSFDKNEAGALEAAIVALRYHSLNQRPETSPSLALAELVDSLEMQSAVGGGIVHPRVTEALARARAILSLVDAIEAEADEEEGI